MLFPPLHTTAGLPLALLHLLHRLWKVLVECLWEEEVDHGGGHGEAPHQDVGQELVVGPCGGQKRGGQWARLLSLGSSAPLPPPPHTQVDDVGSRDAADAGS